MIGLLIGKIAYRNDQRILLVVQGVGYNVHIAPQLFSSLSIGSELTLFTHTHVREDALELFGFPSVEDLRIFEMLLGVSGIGPKSAIGIFTVGSKQQIINAVIQADVDFFTGVPRLGKKNAQKIIIELKSKIGSIEELDLRDETDDTMREVIGALKGIGFSEKEVKDVLKEINGQGETVEEKVRLALKALKR